MKKEMIYTGQRIISGEILGLSFIELKGKEKVFCKGKNAYCIGGVYEFDFKKENRFVIGSYIEGKDIQDLKKIREWDLENAKAREYKERIANMKRLKKGDQQRFMNLTLEELKEQCQSNYQFKRLIFYWILGGTF